MLNLVSSCGLIFLFFVVCFAVASNRTGLALCHASPIQDVQHVLVLRQKQATITPLNTHSQEVM